MMNPYPIRFRPIFKRTLWGGRRLAELLNKPTGEGSDYAESWEVVDHGSDQSVVENGPLSGTPLADLVRDEPDWLLGPAWRQRLAVGSSDDDRPRFPLLLKYLDCNRVLSVQVHPDDRYAAQMATPDLGKTEAWYIVASTPESVIYAGLKPGVDRQTLAEAVRCGQTDRVLHSFHPEPGDCIFIPAGTVHALGAGLLVAEIQQSSDTTFRLFDWNRVGADGQPRMLHIEQALEVTDYHSGPVAPRSSEPTGGGWQTLVECEKFVLGSLQRGAATLGGSPSFHIVTVPRGGATLRTSEEQLMLRTGETVLLPAAMSEVQVAPAEGSTVLEMHLR